MENENKRDCPRHGYLARKCPICEQEQDEALIESLQAKLALALRGLKEIAALAEVRYSRPEQLTYEAGVENAFAKTAAIAARTLAEIEGEGK